MIKTKPMDSIPKGSNPFNHDSYNMGTEIAKNILIMHPSHPHERTSYLIIVNKETGERIRVKFDE